MARSHSLTGSTKVPRGLFAPPDPDTPKRRPEWRLQAECVSKFRKLQDAGWDFEFAGDGGGLALSSKREAGLAKLTGCLEGGEPDLRIYLPGGKTAFVEYKADGGRLSAAQIARHARMAALGFTVRVIQADTPERASELSVAFLKELGLGPTRTLH